MTLVDDFRQAMSLLASTVYVVTTRDDQARPRGFTATSVIPHGKKPASVVVAVDHSAHSHDTIVTESVFGLNVLSGRQKRLAELFASKRPDKFQQTGWKWKKELPILEDAFAHAHCRIEAARTVGDHTLLFGSIEEADVSKDDDEGPLLFFDSKFSVRVPGPPTQGAP